MLNLNFRRIIFFLILVPVTAFSQNITLQGVVTDEVSRSPLVGVTVLVAQAGVGGYTDDAGKYSLTVPYASSIEVRFTYIGYDTLLLVVRAPQGKTEFVNNVVLKEEGVQGEEVVITAGKYEQKLADVPISMEIIKPKAIELQTTSTIEDVLQQAPGVDVMNGQLNIRGSSGFAYGVGSRVMIMLDGLPLLTADANFAQFDLIPTDNIAQVEIMKGAASVLYGSSAMGGVVNVITGDAAAKPRTSLRLRSSLYDHPWNRSLDWDGNSGATITSLNFNHSRKFKNNDFTFLIDGIRNTGYIAGTSQKKVRSLVTLKFRPVKAPGLTIGVNSGFVADSSGAYLYWDSYNTDTNSTVSRNKGAPFIGKGALVPDSSTLRRQFNTRITFDPSIKYLTQRGDIFAYKSRILLTANRNNTNQSATNTLFYNDAQFVSRFWKQKVALITGVNFIYSNVLGDSLYGGPHYMYNMAAYSQIDTKVLNDKLNLTLGGRFEQILYDDGYSASAPIMRVGANYKTFKGNNIRASFGQAFRAPSVAERYTNTVGGSLVISPNPDLKVERGFSTEIGMRQGFKFGNKKNYIYGFLDAAAFIMDFNNMIEFGVKKPDVVVFDNPTFWAYNISHARIYGTEGTGLVSGQFGDFSFDFQQSVSRR